MMDLREEYFRLRQRNDALRAHGHRFEMLPWHFSEGAWCRANSNGWGLRVYHIEGEVEACVIAPDGQSMTYC